MSNVLKQTQKCLDDTQNDNFVLKSENTRLQNENQAFKIRAQENDILHAKINDLNNKCFNYEKKIQDILTSDVGLKNSKNITDNIEMRQKDLENDNLKSRIFEKESKIEELTDDYNKLKEEHDKIKTEFVILSTKNDIRNEERQSYEKQLESF